MTVYALMMLMASIMVGGIAVDASSFQARTTLMQNAADSAAHAAILMRTTSSASAATAQAISIAQGNMPPALYGNALVAGDVVFGRWDATRRVFTPDTAASGAVQVTVRQTAATANPYRTLVTRLLGQPSWDAVRTSVMIASDPDCMREGFVAQGRVDIQSNNLFKRGFCIHSNTGVKISSNNTFEPGVHVTMPSLSTLQIPNSGLRSNPGLEAALGTNRYDLRVLERLSTIQAGLSTSGSPFIPSYITNPSVVTLTSRAIRAGDLTAGRIYRVTCGGNQDLSIVKDVILSRVVITTNCAVKFGQGAGLENAVLSTTSTAAKSITGASSVSFGKNDACATGGGAQVLTMGGIDFPSGLRLYGGQLLAKGDISFSANGDGVQGASLVAGGTISGTSNMTMASCDGRGMEQNFRMPYPLMVQ